MTSDLQRLQKIVSLTTLNNIRLIPLTCSYAQQLALGIGMSEARATVIAEAIRVVPTRRMTYAYQGIGEITLDILVGLDRLVLEIADKGRDGQRFSMCFYIAPDIDILSFQKQADVEEPLLDDALKVRRASAEDQWSVQWRDTYKAPSGLTQKSLEPICLGYPGIFSRNPRHFNIAYLFCGMRKLSRRV